MLIFVRSLLYAFTALLAFCQLSLANDKLLRLKQLSLEELANLEISIASKKPEKLADIPAAVFVITQEDIRRSGATKIPQLLRMVPGLHIAHNDVSEWSVSSRGFAGRVSNKLLVLLDGRSIYTPLFSGVFWEAQDTLLEDIARIEVIRGPGAAVWGANAVNGVINIISKHAGDTQGGLAVALAGDQQREVKARYGGQLNDHAYYRMYAKYHEHDPAVRLGGIDNNDEWEGMRSGFRLNWQTDTNNLFRLQGDIYKEDADDPEIQGANLLTHWQHNNADDSSSALQLYYDHTRLISSGLLEESRDTLDIEFQYQIAPLGRHDILWGLGYRLSRSDIQGTEQVQVGEETNHTQLFSAFIQDDIQLTKNTLYLTLGSKLEHNDFSGFEFQPNVRLRWHPQSEHTFWLSASRAVRTPSQVEHDITFDQEMADPSPETFGLPVVARLMSNTDFDAEDLIAYEIGYRFQLHEHLALDMSVFYNDYKNLRTLEAITEIPFPEPLPIPKQLVLPVTPKNKMSGETYGLELAADWRVRDWWRLQAAYSFLDVQLHPDSDSTGFAPEIGEGLSPNHEFSLRSSMDLSKQVEFDLWARYVDELPAANINDYFTLDARLAWKPIPNLELSLVGRNLLDKQHQEFLELETSPTANPIEIEREIYGRLEWRF